VLIVAAITFGLLILVIHNKFEAYHAKNEQWWACINKAGAKYIKLNILNKKHDLLLIQQYSV
jgi:hypothetical protein